MGRRKTYGTMEVSCSVQRLESSADEDAYQWNGVKREEDDYGYKSMVSVRWYEGVAIQFRYQFRYAEKRRKINATPNIQIPTYWHI